MCHLDGVITGFCHSLSRFLISCFSISYSGVDYFGFLQMVLSADGDLKKGLSQKRTVKVILVVIPIILIIVNKSLLDISSLKTDAPFFITFYQCLLTISLLNVTFPEDEMAFRFLTFNPKILQSVSPLSMTFIGMITLNKPCLQYIGLDISWGWHLNTISNVLLSYILVTQTKSLYSLLSCAVILRVFWLGVTPEPLQSLVSCAAIIFIILTCICAVHLAIFFIMMTRGGFWLGITHDAMYSLVSRAAIVFIIGICLCLLLIYIFDKFLKDFISHLRETISPSTFFSSFFGIIIIFFLFCGFAYGGILCFLGLAERGRNCFICAMCILMSYGLL
ncbi:uncharacterized protein [Engystomops pustulosus]|uniref:uncharacterized protein n=1 Tax=Engystomops pustulosus TaxID=76066 RepID=UPI003AFB415A